ncbi:MAG: hypothetical protein LBF62_04760, partial [Tannerellaceae bacterium]|nr:hypothetical protein [Tannerellaceae bacterium]
VRLVICFTMKYCRRTCVYLVFSLLFFSCNREKGEDVYFLEIAEKAMAESPFSALQALKAIRFPEDLNKDLFMLRF